MPINRNVKSTSGIGVKIFENHFVKPLTYIIPKANPDFDDKIMNVTAMAVGV